MHNLFVIARSKSTRNWNKFLETLIVPLRCPTWANSSTLNAA